MTNRRAVPEVTIVVTRYAARFGWALRLGRPLADVVTRVTAREARRV
jgi:hypothetical protein